jgi:hypothetical protein
MAHYHALRVGVAGHDVVCRGLVALSIRTPPQGTLKHLGHAQAVSHCIGKGGHGIASEAAMGRVSNEMDEARQAQVRRHAWDLSPAAPGSRKRSWSDAKASAVASMEAPHGQQWQ